MQTLRQPSSARHLATPAQARRNLRLLYLSGGLRDSWPIMAIVVPYYTSHGLTTTHVFMLQGITFLVSALCELPTGYLADRFGRRVSMLCGVTVWVIGQLWFALSTSFLGWACAWAIIGVAASFWSGADVALGRETLQQFPVTGTLAFHARLTTSHLTGGIVGGVVGGLLATVGFTAVLWTQVAVITLLVPLTLALREPTDQAAPYVLRSPLAQASQVRHVLRTDAAVRWWVICLVVFGAGLFPIVWLCQIYYGLLGLPLGVYGLLWAGQQTVGAVSARLVRYIRPGLVPAITTAVVAASHIALGLWAVPAMLACLGLVVVVRSWIFPVMRDGLNSSLEQNDIRATTLSFGDAITRVGCFAAGLLVGVAADTWGVRTALVLWGVVAGVACTAVVLAMRRHRLLG